MNTNSTQTGDIPSELLPENKINTFDLDRLISDEVVVTSQPLVQLNTTNMIPSPIQDIPTVPGHNILTRRQLGRRRRRQRQQQRRQEHRQQQYQQRQRQIQQARREGFGRLYENQRYHDRWQDRFYNGWQHLDSSDEFMDQNYIQPLLDVYNWEKMDPNGRWEQEQLEELEGFVVLEQLQLIEDETEQLHHIDEVQK